MVDGSGHPPAIIHCSFVYHWRIESVGAIPLFAVLMNKHLQFLLSCSSLAFLGWWLIGWEVSAFMAGFAGIGFFVKSLREGFVAGFEKVTRAIGKVQVAIFMTIVYVLVLLPTAFFYQRKRKIDPDKTGNFVSRNHTMTLADLEKMW